MFVHNDYTRKIFDVFANGTGNVFIQARAGTGKTTSLIEMLKHFYDNPHLYPESMQGSQVCFVAFSNEVKKELDRRVPQGERVAYEKSVHNLLQRLLKTSLSGRSTINAYKRVVEELTTYQTEHQARPGITSMLNEVMDALNKEEIVEAIVCSEDAMANMSDIQVKTFHGLGYGILRSVLGAKILLDDEKYYKIVKDYIKPLVPSTSYMEVFTALKALVNYTRLSFTDPEDIKAVRLLAIQYDIDLDRKRPDLMMNVIRWLPKVLKIGEDAARDRGQIDYTDMIYLPIKWDIKSPNPYKLMFIDEAQDLSMITRKLVYEQSMDPTGRAFFIGDENQAIFGFAGSDVFSVRDTIATTKAQELSLDICYRCPTSHIEMAQKLVPAIKPRPDAGKGTVVCADSDILTSIVKPGDMVLSRTTAPLFQKAIECLKAKVPARIRGRDLCESLVKVLRKIEKEADSTGVFKYKDLENLITKWAAEETAYLVRREASEASIQLVADKAESLQICRRDIKAKNLDELIEGIQSLIPSTKGDGKNIGAVEFSTIHRAKGLEAERIFIIEPNKLPLIWDSQLDWQFEQEKNLLYVAITRSKEYLCVFGSENVWKSYMGVITPTHKYIKVGSEWTLKPIGEVLPKSESTATAAEVEVVAVENTKPKKPFQPRLF